MNAIKFITSTLRNVALVVAGILIGGFGVEKTRFTHIRALRLVVLSIEALAAVCAQTFDLNTVLMESTFKIGGPARPPDVGKMYLGTGFIVGKPLVLSLKAWYVLVTAAHVFDNIQGNDLHIVFRKKQLDGSYVVDERIEPFRVGEKNLYAQHPTADVAALYIDVPSGVDIQLLGLDTLATEETFKSLGIHPNEELTALGYPLGEAANDWGFPILGSGRLASYPITPIKLVKTFLFGFKVFEGDSGGPVYLYAANTRFAEPGKIPLTGHVQTIVGLVSEQKYSNNHERLALPMFPSKLDLAVIVPAQFIRETIDMLPFEPPAESMRRDLPKFFPSIFKRRNDGFRNGFF